jgi:hypothetical protein
LLPVTTRRKMQLIATLLNAATAGFVVYAVVVLACWLAAGRPDATEMTMVRQFAEVWKRVIRP